MGTEVVIEQAKIHLIEDDGHRVEIDEKDGCIIIRHLPSTPLKPSEVFLIASSLVAAGKSVLTGGTAKAKDVREEEQARTIESFLVMVDHYCDMFAKFEKKRTFIAIGKAMELRLREL